MSQLLGGLSLLNDGANVSCRLNPNTDESRRWVVGVDNEREATGPTLLEAVTSAYRGSIAELEAAVQRQVNSALERA